MLLLSRDLQISLYKQLTFIDFHHRNNGMGSYGNDSQYVFPFLKYMFMTVQLRQNN